MTQYQLNKLSMYLAVLAAMDKYKSAWSALTGIADMVSRLSALAGGIGEASGVQGTKLTGIAEGKRRKRVAMATAAAPIAADLHALAVSSGDADLEAKTDYELTDLLQTGQNLIGPLCQNFHDWAVTKADALATGFGTTAEDLADLQAKITDYKPDISKPRDAVGARKRVTGDIATDEKTADALLKKELDKTMKKFKVKNPAFFNEYTNARMIIDLGGRHDEEKPEDQQNPPAENAGDESAGSGDATPPPAK